MNKNYFVLASLFITCLLTSNIIAAKIVDLWGMQFPSAVFVYPVTFLLTDTINEVWGQNRARLTVMTGFFMSLVMLFFLYLGQILPPAPFYEHQEAYQAVLGAVPRIVLASMLAYLISQLYDVWMFNVIKKMSKGKFLWLRNNLSTVTSQLIDTVVFITVAFWGVYPGASLGTLILSQYLVKLIIAVIDTPFCYLLVNRVKSGKESETNG